MAFLAILISAVIKLQVWDLLKAKYNIVKKINTNTHRPFSSTEQGKKKNQLPGESCWFEAVNGFHIDGQNNLTLWAGRIPLQLFHTLIWSDSSLILMRWEWGDYGEKSLISLQQSWESNYPFHVPSERLQPNEREEHFFFLCWHPADDLRTLIISAH